MTYKNFNEREKELISYLKQNPTATYRQIKRDTKIKVERLYPHQNMKAAFQRAAIHLPKSLRRRTRHQQKEEVIEFIKQNPSANTVTILNNLGVGIPRLFGTIENAYAAAGKVYCPAIKLVGCTLPEIKVRAAQFEQEAIQFLSSLGEIIRKVRTPLRKEADAIWHYGDSAYIIEIKNYLRTKVTLSEIKQVLNYMVTLHCAKAIIIHLYPDDHPRIFSRGTSKILIINYDRLVSGEFFNYLHDV